MIVCRGSLFNYIKRHNLLTVAVEKDMPLNCGECFADETRDDMSIRWRLGSFWQVGNMFVADERGAEILLTIKGNASLIADITSSLRWYGYTTANHNEEVIEVVTDIEEAYYHYKRICFLYKISKVSLQRKEVE